MEVIQNREFTNLPEEDVYMLLSSDDLNIPDEEDIFRVIILKFIYLQLYFSLTYKYIIIIITSLLYTL